MESDLGDVTLEGRPLENAPGRGRPAFGSATKTRGESADSPLTTMPENSHAGTLLDRKHYQESYQRRPGIPPSTDQGLARMVAACSAKLGHAKTAKPTIFVEAAGRPGRIRAPLRGE